MRRTSASVGLLFILILVAGSSHQFNTIGQNVPQRRAFGSRDEFFAAHKQEVIERLGLQPLDSTLEVDRMIQAEMDALDKVARFRTIVTKGQGDQILSHPETGIVISPEQMEHIRRVSNVRKFQQILRFLLAHEKSHEVQYIEYTSKSVHDAAPELRRVYECQADILAGKYLIESFGEPTEEDRNAIEDALQVAFDLGTEKYVASSDHPSHEGRRVAVRLGMTAGIITLVSKRLPDPPAVSIVNSLSGKINIRQGETVMGWSLRLAKKITHYNSAAYSDLTLEDDQIDWDETAAHPFVTFNLVYKNEGERIIKVDMEVQCLAVLRTSESDSRYWQKWSARNFIFRLPPGETYTVRGRLQWYEDSKLKRRLIYPRGLGLEDLALVSADYVGK